MKTRILPSVCLVVFAVLLNGCASVYRVPLSPEASAQLNSSNTSGVIAVEKDEIGTSINPSQAGMAVSAGLGFGLIGGLAGAIIDSSANSKSSKKAEADAVEIRDGLLDYSFDQALAKAFSQKFASAGGSPALTAVVVSKNTAVSEISRLVQEAKGDAVAVVFVKHLMTPDFSNAVLVAEAVVCARSDALRKIAVTKTYAEQEVPVLYRNRIQTFWPLPTADRPQKPESKTNAAAWAKDKARDLRTALDAAAGEMAQIVYWDLNEPARESYDKDAPDGAATMQINDYAKNAATPVQAKVYRRENNRMWLRATDGCVYVLSE